MSLKIDRLQLEIIINNDQARKSLRALEDEARQLKRDLKKVPEGSDEWNRIKDRLKAIQQQHDKIIESIGIEKLTIRELGQRQKELNSIMRNLDPSSKAYKDLEKQLITIKNRQAQLRASTNKTHFSLKKMAAGFNQYFGIITAGAASFAGLIFGARKAVQTFNDFEETVDNLQSLTGLATEEMKYLEDQAKKTSISSIEGGIRIRQSAKDIVDAYTLVGSQRPELLKNKEALHEVTQEAIILSEAAKMKLEPSAAALTNTLNQFQEKADQSRRIINILSAGSQAGAGNIEYLSQAIEKTGTTANLMNISIEQTVGLIEMAAPFYKRAEMAGNSLDKVLLKLKANNIGYKDGVFDVNRAINELKQRYSSGESAAKIFGVEHAKMGEVLVANQGEFNRYTKMVTGSNKAVEQAAINTDNSNSKLDQARNRMQLARIELGEKLAPAMTSIYSKGSLILKFLTASIDLFTKYGRTILSAVAGITAYYIAVKIAHNWDKIHYGFLVAKEAITKAYAFTTGVLSGKIKIVTILQKKWNAAQKANIIGAIVGLLIAAGTALALYTRRLSAAEKVEREMNKLRVNSQKEIVSEKLAVEQLMKVAKDETKSKNDRLQAIYELNRISPQYLGDLTLETINTKKSTDAVNEYIDSLKRKAFAIAAQERLIEVEKKLIDVRTTGEGADKTTWAGDAIRMVKYFWDYSAGVADIAVANIEKIHDKEAELLALRNELIKQIEDNEEAIKTQTQTTSNATKLTKKDIEDFIEAVRLGVVETTEEVRKLTAEEVEAVEKAKAKKLLSEQNYVTEVIKYSKSLIEQENSAYEDRLKKAGIFGKNLSNLTFSQKLALITLHKQHQDNIAKINGDAINKAIIKQKEAFDQETMVRQTKHNEEMLALGNNKQAKKRLDEQFKQEELQRQLDFLNKVKTQLQNAINNGEWEGISIADGLLSDEEKEQLIQKLNEIGLTITEFQTKINNSEEGEKKDIFGMTPSDWQETLDNLEVAFQALSQVGNIWASLIQRTNNKEDQAFKRYEKNIQKKKDEHAKELEQGVLTQEEYTAKIVQLDSDLDKRKKEIEADQQRRANKLAVFQIMTNTAQAIMKIWAEVPKADFGAATFILAGLAAAAGLAQIAALPKVDQYYDGNYVDVVGQKDGKKRRAKVVGQNHKSGLFSEPTYVPGFGMFGDTTPQKELVFNPKDTQKILNSPALIDSINYTLKGVPQFYEGNYPKEVIKPETSEPTTTQTIYILSEDDRQTITGLISMYKRVLNEGLDVPLTKIKKAEEKYNRIEDSVTP